MREYPFELAVCAHLEATTDWVVARQLGGGVRNPGGRVVDVVGVVPGPDFEERRAITPATIPPAAVESDVGPGRAVPPGEAIDGPSERARGVADRAVEVGFFERERVGSRDCVRQATRYPDGWFDRLVAVENKPDLGSPGALETQLRTDASLGLFDEVLLVTESYVTGAHLNRIPDPVGVWRFDADAVDTGSVDAAGDGTVDAAGTDGDDAADTRPAPTATDAVTVVREPESLSPDEPGIEILAEHPGRTDVAVVSAAEKARRHRAVAERAYGKGWRPDSFPACVHAAVGEFAGRGGLPDCDWKGRVVNPAHCGPDCPGYEAADPPAVDVAAERAAHSPWDPDPEGRTRRQAGLGRFGEGG